MSTGSRNTDPRGRSDTQHDRASGLVRTAKGDCVNSVGTTTTSAGGRWRDRRGRRAGTIIGVAIGAAALLAPAAAANPDQPVSTTDSGATDANQQSADAVGRLIRLADRAATIGTDPIALAELTTFASSTLAAAQDNGVIADASGPMSATARCIVDVIARGVSDAPAQSMSCLAPLSALDPLLALRIVASLQVDTLDPSLPHNGDDQNDRQGPAASPSVGDDSPVPDSPPPTPETSAPETPAPEAAGKRGSAPGDSVPSRAGSAVAPSSGLITSNFGARGGAQHGGVDIANSVGTPIVAAADGTVVSAGPAQGFGLWVRIRHDDGSITTYGHNNGNSVTVGQRVSKGDQIAQVGNRGNSTGPHLHFETTSPGGQKVDPQVWLGERGAAIGAGTIAP